MPPRVSPPVTRSKVPISSVEPTPIASIVEEGDVEPEPEFKTFSPTKQAFADPVLEEEPASYSKGKQREPYSSESYPNPSDSYRQKSPSIPPEDFLSALKGLSFKSKSEAGKMREPEPFTGTDPRKLRPFILQCQLYFRGSADFENDTKKVNFALTYLRDLAQDWFEPGISGLTDEPPEWLYDWEAFLEELRTNFGPYDEIGDAESELTNLRMKDNQRISEYLIKFNSLSVRCPWGEPALRYRFYEGLPPRMKDELSKGEGKPRTLPLMKSKCQVIDARYWERVQERVRENQQTQRSNPSKSTTSTATTSIPAATTQKSKTGSGFGSGFDQKQTIKPKDSKPATPRVDLTGKLDSRGKLTQQERQRRIDKNLCLFCGGFGHRTDNCPVKASSTKARASTTETVTPPAKAKPKESGSEAKKN
jgi:ferredoxin